MKEGWEHRGGIVDPGASFSKPQQSQGKNLAQCGECEHWANGYCVLRKQTVAAPAPFAQRCNFFTPGKGEKREVPEQLVELPPIAEKAKNEVAKTAEEGPRPEVAVATAQKAPAQAQDQPTQVRQAEAQKQAGRPAKSGEDAEGSITVELFPGVRAVLKVPVFSGVVEVEVVGDSVALSFNGSSVKGTLLQLRQLAEEVGLREKDLLILRIALERLGIKVPGPPLPLDFVEKLPLLSPSERLEALSWLQPGDLGLEHLLKLALAEGWLEEKDLVDIKKAVRKVPSHVKAFYAARLLEEWGLLRVVLLKLAPEEEERATGEAYEGRCVVVGDNLLYPLERWEAAASKFFRSALSREVLSYVKNHPATLSSKVVPLERVNPHHQLRLRGWVLDLRDLRLLPPSLSDYYFTYEVNTGLSEEELRSLVESARRGDYQVEHNRIYELWREHFEDREWEFFVDAVGTFLAPHRFRFVGLIIGEKGCGKTSLLNAVTKAIDPLTGRTPLSQLAGENRFAAQTLIAKWINVYSEQLRPVLKNLEVINNLVGESDWIFVDRKHKPPIWIRSLKSMLFAGNAVPVIQSWSEGVMDAFLDRLSIIFIRKPEGFKPEKEIAERIPKGESLAFLLWARWQLEQRGWEVRKRSEEELLDLLMEAQSPVAQFIEEKCVRDEHGRVERGALYEAYIAWLKERGITKVPSRGEFYTQIRLMGFQEGKAGNKRYFRGLRLAEDRESQLELQRFEEA